MYILTITNNYDTSYVCKAFASRDEAIKELHSLLTEEVNTVKVGGEYNPAVKRYDESFAVMIYEENAEEGQGFNEAYYKVMECEISEMAHEIVECFEDLLDKKEIEIPCEDDEEQKERYDGGNDAKIYGTEYGNLVSEIEGILGEWGGSR